MDTLVENKLVRMAVKGNVGAFEKLLSANLKVLYNICYSLLGNEEDAKDATQEASIKIYSGIKNFRLEAKFSTWMYRIAVNASKDLIKRRYKNVSMSLDAEVELSGDAIIAAKAKTEETPEDASIRKENMREIRVSISSLPYEGRELIVLRDLRGLSYEEISEITEKNIGTVKSGLHRARKLLVEDLISKGIVPSNFRRRLG